MAELRRRPVKASDIDTDGTRSGSKSESDVSILDEGWTLSLCLAFRLLNALLVRTYFNPDEHWQALEVAHRVVFGYGHLTWEWERGIRSYVHPLLFGGLYKLIALAGMDTPVIMARAPRLFQAPFAAMGDFYLFKLSLKLFGRRAANWTLFCQLLNWFTFFSMVRTLSNSLETSLTTVALFYWPGDRSEANHRRKGWLSTSHLALSAAALSCLVRPTNGIVWVYMGVIELILSRSKIHFVLVEVVPVGVFCLSIGAILDRWMYGYWIFVPWNFLKFNFFSSGGDFYGTHPWHWYFTQGFSVMLFTFLPITMAGVWWAKKVVHAGLVLWVLSIYSILGHKEFRFVLPVLPLCMMFAGYGLSVLEEGNKFKKHKGGGQYQGERQIPIEDYDSRDKRRRTIHSPSSGFRWIIVGLLVTNVPAAFYTSMIHQRGGEAVMEYLAREAYHDRVESVLFLMPCHSTPFYSSIHNNLPMRFLDCSPSDEVGYVDEADRFMANPMGFLREMFPSGQTDAKPLMPSHVVLYDSLHTRIRPFLSEHQYTLFIRKDVFLKGKLFICTAARKDPLQNRLSHHANESSPNSPFNPLLVFLSLFGVLVLLWKAMFMSYLYFDVPAWNF